VTVPAGPLPAVGRRASTGRSVPPELLEAFHRDLFLPLVWRATWRHGLSKEDARDVVQEAFLLAVVKMRGQGNPRGWLFQVVDNLCANYQRKTLRRARLAAKWGTAPTPESEFDQEADD